MKEFILQFKSYDLSSTGTVRPSAIMRRMQQAAREDLDSFGVTYQDMRDRNMAFVVSRMSLKFFRPLRGGVNYTLKTGPMPSHGATFPRSFIITDEEGPVMVAMSLWALLDFEKRCLLRASAFGTDLDTIEDLTEGFTCERISKPRDLTPVYFDERRVYSSLLDENCHLNNCNYADLATDLIPGGKADVKEMHISFQKEATLDEVLLMNAYEQEDSLLVSGTFKDRDEPCFLCKICLF